MPIEYTRVSYIQTWIGSIFQQYITLLTDFNYNTRGQVENRDRDRERHYNGRINPHRDSDRDCQDHGHIPVLSLRQVCDNQKQR